MSYEFVVKWRGATFWQHVKAYCRDDRHLSAVRIVIEGTNDDGRKEPTSESTISGGTLVRTREGARRYEAKAPGKVMTEFTIFEVIRRLPFEKGVVLEFTSVEEGSHVKEGHKITYAGKELVRVGRDLVELHRFDQTGPAIRPMQLWVDDNHELIRVVMDGRKEFLLTTKADATAAFRADGPADR